MVFDMVLGSTLHFKGKKDLKVSTTGGKKKKHFNYCLSHREYCW